MSLVGRFAAGMAMVVPVASILGLAAWAWSLPAAYTAAGTVEVPLPVDQVFTAVSAGRTAGANWGAGFAELGPTKGAPEVQAASHHPHEVVEGASPGLFVTTFLPGAPMEGTSTWTFEAAGSGATRVTLVQEAEVPALVSRAQLGLSRDPHADIQHQLQALLEALADGDRS